MNRRALCAAVLAVACSAAFGRTALHGFLFWDDRAFIAENPLIAHPSAASLLALWTTPLHDLYAPLTYTLWGLLAAVFGPKPWAFHLTNVALHTLNAALVFAVLRRLVTEDDGRAALAGALLFAVHPVQSEAVAWASEAKDLLSALFSLLAIRQYLVFREGENRRAYLWASGAFACALLAKPSAVVAPVLLVILNRGIQRRDWAGSLRGLSPWFVAAAAFTLIAAHVQPAAGLHFVAPVWLRPAIALDALTFYLGKLVLPLHLIPDYGRTSQSVVSSGALAYTWIPAAALLAAGWVLRQKLPWMAAAVALFVAALLPVLGLVPFDFQYYSNVADHYLYLAMIGPALGLAFACARPAPLARRILVPLALASLLASSFLYASHWKDDATLYAHTLAVNPRSFMAHNNLGQMLEEEGRFEDALSHYRAALEADPGGQDALNNIGNVLYKEGRYDEAIRHYADVIGRSSPAEGLTRTAARMHNNLGAAYLKKSLYDGAAIEFQRAMAIDPDYLEPYYNLALVLMAFGRYAEAIPVLRRGLVVNPDHAELRRQLALAMAKSGG